MKKMLEEGKLLALPDFDGFNTYEEAAMKTRYRSYVNKCKKDHLPVVLREEDFTSIRSTKDAVDCPFMPVGHAFVIKALPDGDISVENGEVIDHCGMLL